MSNVPFTIRPATPADQETIVAFNAALAEETEAKSLDRALLEPGVRAALADPAMCLYFVAEAQGRVIGQIMITTEWSDWRNGWFWWIQSVYVDAAWRRRGVFRALYHHVRTQAVARPDVCGLRLYMHHENTRARSTYESLGMHVTDYLVCEDAWSPEP